MNEAVNTIATTIAEPGAFAFLESGLFWGFLGAALCALLTFIGSARGVNIAGEAAAGLVTEDPSMFGKIVIIENLPATQAIYGLLIAFVAVNSVFSHPNLQILPSFRVRFFSLLVFPWAL